VVIDPDSGAGGYIISGGGNGGQISSSFSPLLSILGTMSTSSKSLSGLGSHIVTILQVVGDFLGKAESLLLISASIVFAVVVAVLMSYLFSWLLIALTVSAGTNQAVTALIGALLGIYSTRSLWRDT
jgi:hypothetical protein